MVGEERKQEIELSELGGNPKDTAQKKTYSSTSIRWYILVVHSLVGIGQVLVYSTWGAIALTAEQSFGLTPADFVLLPNWYNISYFISIFPFMWMLQNTGFRTSELVTAGLCACGAWVRCLTFGRDPSQYRYFIHLGQFINGLASPIPWMGCTYISALWFPPNERTMATSIGLGASGIGSALSFIVGPMVVQAFASNDEDRPPTDEENYIAIRKLLYLEALYCIVMYVIVIWYFPSRPKHLPSFTAGQDRTPFGQGLKNLLANSQSWSMLGVYAISSGIYASWTQILTIFVGNIMSEIEAGWLGFTVLTLGIVSSPILSLTSPIWIERHSKLVCIVLLTIGCAALTVTTLSAYIFTDIFEPLTMWITMVISGITLTAPQAVWWELSCEAAYPVSEGVVSGVFTLASCIVSSVYFILQVFPQLGTEWPTWALLVSVAICIPTLAIYRPSNKRSQIDKEAAG